MGTDNPKFDYNEKPFAPFTIPKGMFGDQVAAKPNDPPPVQPEEEPDGGAIEKLLRNQLSTDEAAEVRRKMAAFPGWQRFHDEMKQLIEDTENGTDKQNPVG